MLHIGLYGLGTVGRGVLQILREKRLPVKVVAVVDRSYQRKADMLQGIPASDNPDFIFQQPKLDAVVEVIGGTTTALYAAKETLERGLPFITANKAMLAEHGYSLFSLANEKGGSVSFEAAVAGAIPIVHNLQSVFANEEVRQLQGILNGTTNYILTRMRREKKEYREILFEAQKLGLAEADPYMDVSGKDAAHKLALLATLITGKFIDIQRILCRGIDQLTLSDIIWAEKMNYRIRLVATCTRDNDGVFVAVEPSLVSEKHYLANIEYENNAVFFKGGYSGPHLMVGKGAGSLPTASSVVADLMRVARGEVYRMPHDWHYGKVLDIKETSAPFYLRLQVLDKPGVLSTVTNVLSKHGISLASVHQEGNEESAGQPLDLVLVTHKTKRASLDQARAGLKVLPDLQSEPVYLPIEEE